ncbi:hypothetical protein ACNTMW_26710 [Planosporangium sp. 12N6]|uniref:hypothetical protein n=1 Tax=Planosporangium spinosum TaxID=3402278 RepID=UPI003CEF0BF4
MTIQGLPAQPAPGAAPAGSRRRWLVAVTAAWAVLLVGLALYAVGRGGATVRTQTTIGQALPTVDRAVAEVAAAATDAGAVAEIDGYREVSARCTITAIRDGARYERAVHLYVPAGQEPALLDRIRAALPRDYGAQVRRTGNHELSADAGDFVAVRGGVAGTGEVRIAADTGCRPLTGPVTEAQPPSVAANRLPGQAVLTTLNVTDVHWQTHRVPCERGGSIWTVQADGPPASVPASLADALRPAAPDAILARPDLYVYRSGPVGVVARARDGAVTVTATTGCGVQ